MLLAVALILRLLAAWQAGRQGNDDSSGEATQVEQWLNTTGVEAEKVRNDIGSLLDNAYAQAYAGIPKYMDFRYSQIGEWLGLGEAALGNLGGGLEKYLSDGFDERLNAATEQLVQGYDERYWAALDNAMAEEPGGAGAFGPLVV